MLVHSNDRHFGGSRFLLLLLFSDKTDHHYQMNNKKTNPFLYLIVLCLPQTCVIYFGRFVVLSNGFVMFYFLLLRYQQSKTLH